MILLCLYTPLKAVPRRLEARTVPFGAGRIDGRLVFGFIGSQLRTLPEQFRSHAVSYAQLYLSPAAWRPGYDVTMDK